eukprot:CAMPEP_0176344584 /NCGR_PEP_ID=MMETSP0126-20121128/4807_1 /TAXON_ID=141414 ORGANISM="Strombidinopsis acuminatum, Strain SPMC142" /NCGR_SAMPLE_ID=MMETSP0126 /ASSEMBLY_ACC=CAM_ASM_000229 /LENGTH=62 /DNA_ID=CAMNT_0017691113 /DNA_START=586 /DNA_END=774 /DNA_ORIENTATION=+
MGSATRDDPIKGKSPEPGSYNPTLNYSAPKAPAFKMGTDARSQKQKNAVPGPGNYEVTQRPF